MLLPCGCCSEPDSYGLTWLGTQLKGQGLGYWYHQIMKIGYDINPSALRHQVCSNSCSASTPDMAATLHSTLRTDTSMWSPSRQ